MKRLGIPPETPCAVQQWEGLIAGALPLGVVGGCVLHLQHAHGPRLAGLLGRAACNGLPGLVWKGMELQKRDADTCVFSRACERRRLCCQPLCPHHHLRLERVIAPCPNAAVNYPARARGVTRHMRVRMTCSLFVVGSLSRTRTWKSIRLFQPPSRSAQPGRHSASDQAPASLPSPIHCCTLPPSLLGRSKEPKRFALSWCSCMWRRLEQLAAARAAQTQMRPLLQLRLQRPAAAGRQQQLQGRLQAAAAAEMGTGG